jgi:hypothetical protein
MISGETAVGLTSKAEVPERLLPLRSATRFWRKRAPDVMSAAVVYLSVAAGVLTIFSLMRMAAITIRRTFSPPTLSATGTDGPLHQRNSSG